MKNIIIIVAGVLAVAMLALGGMYLTTAGGGGHSTTTINNNQAAPSAAPAPSTPPPVVVRVPAPAPPVPEPAPPQASDAWAVASAYYADLQSSDYTQAWVLMNNGNTLPQTYSQFVNGFNDTDNSSITWSEDSESGNTVSIDISALKISTDTTQYFTGTYTVDNGVITDANVTQTG